MIRSQILEGFCNNRGICLVLFGVCEHNSRDWFVKQEKKRWVRHFHDRNAAWIGKYNLFLQIPFTLFISNTVHTY
jgi:hypothetical protein